MEEIYIPNQYEILMQFNKGLDNQNNHDKDDYPIGLDIGMHYSCMGVYRNGGVEIIPNSYNEKLTPSLVAFKEDEIFVGENAINLPLDNRTTLITEMKKIIGDEFEKIEKEFKNAPFKKDKISPVEILSLIMKKMIFNAKNYLQKKLTNW